MQIDSNEETFDFDAHQREAVEEYRRVKPLYESFAEVTKAILREAILVSPVKVASIDARAKTLDSFGRKAVARSSHDPNSPKYSNPLVDIQDLTGVRIITFFLRTVKDVDNIIRSEFDILEKTDKLDILKREEKLGYQSVHYLVKLKATRTRLPEYARYRDMLAEIQVRTILQHAWAEIEHDIQYKSVETIHTLVRRRFMSLAGLLEIADREFQAIQKEDENIRQEARVSVQEGRLENVEITPDALKAYLDKKLGPDGRMTSYSYEHTARMLRRMGFTNFRQIDECISHHNNDQLSRVIWGTRQGQITRFEDQLLAGMGNNYIELHPWSNLEWFVDACQYRLDRLAEQSVFVGDYIPPHEGSSTT